jgi:hypothetical protein
MLEIAQDCDRDKQNITKARKYQNVCYLTPRRVDRIEEQIIFPGHPTAFVLDENLIFQLHPCRFVVISSQMQL